MKMTTRTRLGFGFAAQTLLTGVLGASVLIGMENMHRQFQIVIEQDALVIAKARQLSKLVVAWKPASEGSSLLARSVSGTIQFWGQGI